MADAQCTCGFTESGDETMIDHLLRVFAADDDTGTDGLVHLEGEQLLTCLCGFAGATPGELDRHFLAVFMTHDAIGPDGEKHEPVA